MKKIFLIVIILLSINFAIDAQPEIAFAPMTAPGARGIRGYAHELYWANPTAVNYNEIFFSSDSILVINQSPTALILSGFPHTVFNSVNLSSVGTLTPGIKHYWRVVEYDSNGSNPGDIWYFKTNGNYPYMDESFSNGLTNWEIVGPTGLNNWTISNSTFSGGQSPELKFKYSPIINGSSFIMYKSIFLTHPYNSFFWFNHCFQWYSGSSTIGCAYTTDEGISWTSIWEINPTANLGPESISLNLPDESNMQIGFYFIGNSYNTDGWFIDDIIISSPLSRPIPPTLLKAKADTSELKVNLSWNAGSSPNPSTGYRIKRKTGLPLNNSEYTTLTTVPLNTLNYSDTSVQLNTIYTYRVTILSGPGPSGTAWSNEATAYVPSAVPAELINFSAFIENNNVRLKWMTATETNNKWFEVERSIQNSNLKIKNFETIGFVNGTGTSTELNTYSFNDENVSAGKYIYRLKQIDYDGSYEYSTEIEVEIALPDEFALYQNFPNPFNPTTIIKYSIPSLALWERVSEGRVRVLLKVYDILGNVVTTLVNEEKPPGEYVVEFNGSKLSSGVFFYQLRAGSYVQTKKMILL
ncbi:MAG: T9SS type A sorting domain-containing protein [Ignavibacteriaceae bacterium]|nr:T9SS type A sorting domain-containing protein [Ignavibacteriaceae bacterium]